MLLIYLLKHIEPNADTRSFCVAIISYFVVRNRMVGKEPITKTNTLDMHV